MATYHSCYFSCGLRFAELGRIPKAFCSVEYVGTRTRYPPTDFSGLQKSVEELLRNNAVRAPRQPEVVLKALQVSTIRVYVTARLLTVDLFVNHSTGL